MQDFLTAFNQKCVLPYGQQHVVWLLALAFYLVSGWRTWQVMMLAASAGKSLEEIRPAPVPAMVAFIILWPAWMAVAWIVVRVEGRIEAWSDHGNPDHPVR